MENLFNALCACLMEKQNLSKFLDGEGLQLMNLMLREKKMSRQSALKVLNYAMTGKDCKANCDKFVDILGKKIIYLNFTKILKFCCDFRSPDIVSFVHENSIETKT